jgi:peptidoglycan/LPS O-acetylase OafA/YrhL
MIQRQQTLWLLLATAAAILTFMFPFATGEEIVQKTALKQPAEIIAGGNFFTLLLTIASIGISTVAIFMFKDRKLQIKLCLLGLLVSVLILVLYFMGMKKLLSATPALWAILPVAVAAGYFMAFRNIRKDEKLIKTLDKLR